MQGTKKIAAMVRAPTAIRMALAMWTCQSSSKLDQLKDSTPAHMMVMMQ